MDESKLREVLFEVIDRQAEAQRRVIDRLRRHMVFYWIDRFLFSLCWFLGGILLGYMTVRGG